VGFGRALLQEYKPDQAQEFLHIALGYDHRNARAHTWLAEALFRTGAIQEARRELEHAARFDPHLADVHLVAGHLYEHLHDPASAAQEYRHALELDPRNPEATRLLTTLSDRKPVP
jgi:Tfp pilus assembly protein PilF